MTTSLDTAFAAMALDLVAELGTLATFTDVPGTYDHTTATAPAGASLGSVKVSPPAPFQQRYVDGDTIQAGDLRVIVPRSGLAFTPALGMQITLGSVTYGVVAVTPYQSGDDIAAYELQVRA